MDRPIIALLDEVVRAARHCKSESQFLGDKDLLLLFSAHLKMNRRDDGNEFASRPIRQRVRLANPEGGAGVVPVGIGIAHAHVSVCLL